MTSSELRQKFLEFFEGKGHAVIPSASLLPENDPTVLFITAGMQPLVPYLMGEKHPMGDRLANIQKCLRTDDVDEVGDNTHHTFFEMLGNWSLGSYWKKEAIEWSFEFLTSPKWMGIDKNRLAVSVFAGDDPDDSVGAGAPFDQESYDVWISLGVTPERIARLPKKNNWWGPAGETGPCGPDTEMFVWVGDGDASKTKFDPSNVHWVEVWNDVFMEYFKNRDGTFSPLEQKNVDTGMGLERMTAVMQNVDDNFTTDIFCESIKRMENITRQKYEQNKKNFRVAIDHIRAVTFLIGDGALPSNKDQGYITRRLLRRAVQHGYSLGIRENFCAHIAETVIAAHKDRYTNLGKNEKTILRELTEEEDKFRQTLERGLREVQKIIDAGKIITAEQAFLFFQSYGFPYEMTREFAINNNVEICDKDDFEKEYEKHQRLSRTASAGKFKGGLTDQGEETTKLHTATHLLLASLRKVLKDETINQKGSNITAERLRFDFNYPEKLTPEQIKAIDDMVNEQIAKKLPVTKHEMTLEEAKAKGAIGVFEHKYGDKVSVYQVGDFSLEVCGGPHVKNTSELGGFKIIKEESSSAGIRRIKATVGGK